MIIVDKIINFFTNPIREFKGYKERKTVGVNLLIVVVFSVILALLRPALALRDSAISNLDEEARKMVIEFYEKASRPQVSIPTTIFATLIAIIISSFIYYLFAKNLTENKESVIGFIDTLEVYTFSYIALLVGDIIISLVKVELLSIPFQIWFYILLVLGFENALDVPRKKFIWVAAVLFILTNLRVFY